MAKESDVELEMISGTPVNITANRNTVHKDSHHTQTLLDRERPKAPLSGPEIDDFHDERPVHDDSYPGTDDGLLEPEHRKHEGHNHHNHGDGEDSDGEKVHHGIHGDGIGTDEDAYGINTRFHVDDRAISPVARVRPNINTYQQRKNLAQGMMDLALFTANVNQLRYVIETSSSHPYYYFSLASITLSLLLQVVVAVGLIMNSRYDVNHHIEIFKADRINNLTVLGIFLVTTVNVFIASFSVAPVNTPAVFLPLLQQAAINITRA